MVEWHNCTRCNKPCTIVPLSLVFDVECKEYGGVWYCQKCKVYYKSGFLTYEQIKELKKKRVELEGENGKDEAI